MKSGIIFSIKCEALKYLGDSGSSASMLMMFLVQLNKIIATYLIMIFINMKRETPTDI